MFTEKDYNELSQDVYRIDTKHPNYDPNIKEGGIIELKEFDYKILKLTSENSMCVLIYSSASFQKNWINEPF